MQLVWSQQTKTGNIGCVIFYKINKQTNKIPETQRRKKNQSLIILWLSDNHYYFGMILFHLHTHTHTQACTHVHTGGVYIYKTWIVGADYFMNRLFDLSNGFGTRSTPAFLNRPPLKLRTRWSVLWELSWDKKHFFFLPLGNIQWPFLHWRFLLKG